VLRFPAAVARCVRERVWHATAVREELPGGGLVLRMRVPVNAGVLRFVLQYGADVEVVAPDALRHRVAETFRRALATYGRETGDE
jgi:predicted DNA-binding transcriptional regulator YafY